MPQSVFLTRHGQRIDKVVKDWKSLPGCPGSLHLSPLGIRQARALGQRLAGQNVRIVYASPFYRTVQTAHLVAEVIGARVCIEHGVCEFLQERYFAKGELGVRPASELAATFATIDTSYRSKMDPRPPEDADALARRCAEAMRVLLAGCSESFLVVSHGTPVRAMVASLTTGPPTQNSSVECALTQVTRVGDGWRLVHDGDGAHLPDDEE